jgi:2-methylaconitate cis-trans-isomerase PrpF
MGIVDVSAKALTESPYIPFFAIVSSPADYKTFNTGREIKFSDIDIVSRLIFMQRMHKTYPGTGTVCTGAAAKIPGTIVNELLTEEAKGRKRILIGHPAGVIPVEAETIVEDGMVKLTRAAILRTARRVMEGYAFVKNSAYSK